MSTTSATKPHTPSGKYTKRQQGIPERADGYGMFQAALSDSLEGSGVGSLVGFFDRLPRIGSRWLFLENRRNSAYKYMICFPCCMVATSSFAVRMSSRVLSRMDSCRAVPLRSYRKRALDMGSGTLAGWWLPWVTGGLSCCHRGTRLSGHTRWPGMATAARRVDAGSPSGRAA